MKLITMTETKKKKRSIVFQQHYYLTSAECSSDYKFMEPKSLFISISLKSYQNLNYFFILHYKYQSKITTVRCVVLMKKS